ncbi:hypothetical protein TNCV_3864961 [Trichonephila clavipes]|nr:hypothetical protein TNCV_3864961 [Trichonephila clavipes]
MRDLEGLGEKKSTSCIANSTTNSSRCLKSVFGSCRRRSIGDGPSNFESRSSDEGKSKDDTPFYKLPHHDNGKTWSSKYAALLSSSVVPKAQTHYTPGS